MILDGAAGLLLGSSRDAHRAPDRSGQPKASGARSRLESVFQSQSACPSDTSQC